jgi:hypothetical protein
MVRDFGISGINRVTFGAQLSTERRPNDADIDDLFTDSLEVVRQALKNHHFVQPSPHLAVDAGFIIGQQSPGVTTELIADYTFEENILVCSARTLVSVRYQLWKQTNAQPDNEYLRLNSVSVTLQPSAELPTSDAQTPIIVLDKGSVRVGFLKNNEFRPEDDFYT